MERQQTGKEITGNAGMRQLFLQHVGQTSEAPLALHITKALGSSLWDADGKGTCRSLKRRFSKVAKEMP